MKPCVLVRGRLSPVVEALLLEHFEVVGEDRVAEVVGMLGVVPDDATLEAAKRLRVIATVSAGYDQYDVGDLSRRGIALMNCPDALTETTADLAFALILATARRVVELASLVRQGGWQADAGEELFGVDVHGATLGIVGLGRIGGAVARRGALGFGMKVLYCGPSEKPEAERLYGARRRGLLELLGESDFVCVTAPLSPNSERMIGREELAAMKPSAILVNVARGKIIDEAALIQTLQEGRLRGAGLDVFEHEPLPSTSPLLSMPNVVALPHIGSATRQTREAMAAMSARNLIDLLVHGIARNVVNPAR